MIDVGQIREQYTPEMALAILICRVYFNTAPATALQQYLENTPIDWKVFRRIITAHQVRPLIYKVLTTHSRGVDKDFLNRLRQESMVIASGNLLKLDELVKLSVLFTQNGINNTPYKGVVLSHYLFGDFITRETADIDMFIAASDFPAARKILIEQGYQPLYYFNEDFEKLVLRHEMEISFSRNTPAGVVKVELHWAIIHKMLDTPLPRSLVFENMQQLTLLGKDIPVLNLQNHLLVLLAHHGVNDMWRTLRHCIDISAIIQEHDTAIDWQALQNSLAKARIAKNAATGFMLCEQLLGIKAPATPPKLQVVDVVQDNLLTFPAKHRNKLSLQNFKLQLKLRDSLTDRYRLLAAYARSGLSPNMRDVETLRLPAHWFPLYYILKPFLFLFRRTNK